MGGRNSNARRAEAVYLFLILTGISLSIASILYSRIYRASVLSFEYVPVAAAQTPEDSVGISRVVVSSVGISVPVVMGYIQDDTWSIPKEAAAHLNTSALPGAKGNTVLYGHDTKEVFAKLESVGIGDQVRVELEGGGVAVYVVTEIQEVSPTDISWVLPTESEVLTLFTCTGLFDQRRLVIRAVPIETPAFI